jgi:hypothetical protein
MNKETGGPAFPQNTKIVAPAGQELHHGFMGGMTLRDYFAAKAMQGMFASSLVPQNVTNDEIAAESYKIAAAMLKAREQ